MSMSNNEIKAHFIEQLKQLLDEQRTISHKAPLRAFIQNYFAMISADDLTGMELDSALGNALSMWKFLEECPNNQPKVVVFNPTYKENGWHSHHTVIRLVQPDEPFIVDSIRLHLLENNFALHLLQNNVLSMRRNEQGKRIEGTKGGTLGQEAIVHIEISRLEDAQVLQKLKQDITGILQEVSQVVADFKPTTAQIKALIKECKQAENPAEDHTEILDFLQWLLKDNFIFLGFEILNIHPAEQKNKKHQGLGLLREGTEYTRCGLVHSHVTLSREEQLLFCKATMRSRVHRHAYPDVIALKRYDHTGAIRDEVRILGLYTSRVYYESPHHIPWLRRKIRSIVEQSQLMPEGHLYKELTQILESFPRDELFQISQQALFDTAISILQIQERRQVKVFMREGLGGLFVTALVYIPREQYTTRLRKRMQRMLVQRLQALDSSFVTYFSESALARVHFIFRTPAENPITIDQEQFTRELIQIATSWEEELTHVILNDKGEAQGNRLLDNYSEAFSPGYKDMFNARTALVDIEYCEQLDELNPLNVSFYKELQDDSNEIRFKVYHLGCSLPLSEQIPIFENLGLRVIGEHPYTIQRKSGKPIWIHDFSMEATNSVNSISIRAINTIFTEAFLKIWFGNAENDAFNRLVLSAQMNWQQVTVFRGYARYMRQVALGFSQSYIADTLCSNIDIAQKLHQLFALRFDPDVQRDTEENHNHQQALIEAITVMLDEVSILSQDRVLRFYLKAICATLRTNFYQRDAKGEPKKHLSFKMNPTEIPDIPKPVPCFEIFIYSVRMEGVHLRGGKVARGGLRWSDRIEDFRTEILGLVKAQHVKNAVIVPTGAKGGFVTKCLPKKDREAALSEGISCYKMFVRGLLDITDNLQKSTVIKPERVVCYDDDDPYLVVAADKGTASFSDIANAIAEESGFWLGDAFASGGSSGYDHKAMGITAKGAWVSVQRHFRECGIDPQKDTISVVGIGDMSGDVFGNGMLLSESIALVAAFNHLHIFIDPNPKDAQVSFKERQRLFDLPRSSWQEYNAQLISAGGGIFSRTAKSISISPQMRTRFAIKASKLPPNELIRALLAAPVDLIWNGGIGTYIKASTETHSEVGDKANDNLRINGCDLRCKVFGEGGNLGVTQSGRIEYALSPEKGRINTDFIDNAAGVDCSDHEVNIKIFLNGKMIAGDITRKQRDQLLESMTDNISQMVLSHNERQTLCLSIAHQYGHRRLDQYSRFMQYLEAKGTLDRAIEFLPDNQTLTERSAHQQGLTRPELSTLMSYAKLDIKEQLLRSDLIDEAYITHEIYRAFPDLLVKQYTEALLDHRLRREIIATQIANQLVDYMGICFAHQLHQSLGVSIAEVAKAFIITRNIFAIETYWQHIDQLSHDVSSQTQYEMIEEVMRLMRRSCRWFCRLGCIELDTDHVVRKYQATVKRFAKQMEQTVAAQLNAQSALQKEHLIQQKVPSKLATQIAGMRFMFYVLPIHDAANEIKQPLKAVAEAFLRMGDYLDFYWFSKTLTALEAANHWEVMIKDSIRDELIYQQKYLAMGLMACDGRTVEERFENWKVNQHIPVQRWQDLLAELHTHPHHELAMFTVANKELALLARSKH